jgi:hypothetical protein
MSPALSGSYDGIFCLCVLMVVVEDMYETEVVGVR